MNAIDIIVRNINALIGDTPKAEIARKAGMKDPAQLHNILSKRNAPGLEVLERIADALDVPMSVLFKEVAPKAKPRSLDSLRLEAISLIAVADMADVTGALIVLKGKP